MEVLLPRRYDASPRRMAQWATASGACSLEWPNRLDSQAHS